MRHEIAWRTVVKDIKEERLNVDTYQRNQAEGKLKLQEKTVATRLDVTWCRLFVPRQEGTQPMVDSAITPSNAPEIAYSNTLTRSDGLNFPPSITMTSAWASRIPSSNTFGDLSGRESCIAILWGPAPIPGSWIGILSRNLRSPNPV